MADPKAASAEPSMEEILASIRRIISEDGGEAGKAPPAAPEPAKAAAPPPPPPPAPEPEPEPPPPPPPPVPEPVAAAPEPPPAPVLVPEPEPELEPTPEPEPEPDPVLELTELAPPEEPMPVAPPRSAMAALDALVSESTAAASAQALASLNRISAGGRTLEDVVRDCLRPLLKDWLDRNLTALTERLVQKEIRRITGQID